MIGGIITTVATLMTIVVKVWARRTPTHAHIPATHQFAEGHALGDGEMRECGRGWRPGGLQGGLQGGLGATPSHRRRRGRRRGGFDDDVASTTARCATTPLREARPPPQPFGFVALVSRERKAGGRHRGRDSARIGTATGTVAKWAADDGGAEM